MKKFKFSSMYLGSFFKREKYDPTQFPVINGEWEESTTHTDITPKNISSTGIYQNTHLPLEEKIKQIKQKLEVFDQSLPTLKK